MTPDPRCACGAPVAFTVQRAHDFGDSRPFVGPYEHVCAGHVPPPAERISCVAFGATSLDAGAMRPEVAA